MKNVEAIAFREPIVPGAAPSETSPESANRAAFRVVPKSSTS